MKTLVLLVALAAQPQLDHAESLVLEARYDQALVELDKFTEDSPRYYYNRMICEYALLKVEDGLESARKLLSFDNLPNRYRDMGHIIKHELENFQKGTLEHASSLMSDSERRLKLGEAGRKVQKSQVEIVDILDRLIEKRSGGPKGKESPSQPGEKDEGKNSPATESDVKGKKSPGNVDRKKLGNNGGWGALPPAEQAEAKQYAEDNYPSHYRKVIEEYTKRMAKKKRRK